MDQWPKIVKLTMIEAIKEVQRKNIGAEYSSLFGKFAEQIKSAADEADGPKWALFWLYVWLYTEGIAELSEFHRKIAPVVKLRRDT